MFQTVSKVARMAGEAVGVVEPIVSDNLDLDPDMIEEAVNEESEVADQSISESTISIPAQHRELLRKQCINVLVPYFGLYEGKKTVHKYSCPDCYHTETSDTEQNLYVDGDGDPLEWECTSCGNVNDADDFEYDTDTEYMTSLTPDSMGEFVDVWYLSNDVNAWKEIYGDLNEDKFTVADYYQSDYLGFLRRKSDEGFEDV